MLFASEDDAVVLTERRGCIMVFWIVAGFTLAGMAFKHWAESQMMDDAFCEQDELL